MEELRPKSRILAFLGKRYFVVSGVGCWDNYSRVCTDDDIKANERRTYQFDCTLNFRYLLTGKITHDMVKYTTK